MHPFLFEVFGRRFGTYGLFVILGAAAAWFLVRMLADKKDKDISLIFFICICGGLIGAFALRPLTRIPEVIIHWQHFRQIPVEAFISYFFGEIVFYGGLIGGIVAMVIFCRGFKIQILPVADIFAPSLALAHGFGRIGCFLSGCCYGIAVSESHPLAVVFPPHSIGSPSGVPLLAMQLIEAACLFILSILLTFVYKRTRRTTTRAFPRLKVTRQTNSKAMKSAHSPKEVNETEQSSVAYPPCSGVVACLYGLLYSVLRFILEFYRGDSMRGIYGVLSTSQIISIALFATSAVMLIILVKRYMKMCASMPICRQSPQ